MLDQENDCILQNQLTLLKKKKKSNKKTFLHIPLLPNTKSNKIILTLLFLTNIGIKHGFLCINIRQVLWEVLKTEGGGRGVQHLPRDLANVNALKNHIRLLLLHKNSKHLLHFPLFLALFCFTFSPMSREHNFHRLCLVWGQAVHIP